MLIMRGPGGFAGGKVFDTMVSHLDIYPTVCDLVGIDLPEWLEGTSLMPLVRGHAARVHDEIFTEMTYHAAYQPQRAIRTERWKYIRRFDDSEHPVLVNCDDSASKELLVEHGWADQTLATEQLYDLVFDPARPAMSPASPRTTPCSPSSRPFAQVDGRARRPPARRARPPPPGAQVNDPSRSRRPSRRGSPRRIPRPRHPGEAEPLAAGGVRRLARAPVLERAQPAVEAAQLPQVLGLSGPEVLAEQATGEQEAKEDPVADRDPIGPGLEQGGLDPLGARDEIGERLAARGAKPGSSGCAVIHVDHRRSACSSPESSPKPSTSRSSRRSSTISTSRPRRSAIGAAVSRARRSGLDHRRVAPRASSSFAACLACSRPSALRRSPSASGRSRPGSALERTRRDEGRRRPLSEEFLLLPCRVV